ncbi:DUF1826 domain-containing protein [Erythrobacter oryzae]|uniref:DUF1826 domain-containing protein n=1 Tax=Erythrobacter oryzae TaxID=3019556 RepID=UPI002554FE0E|nr:DUF1826 domain-containing protein [Erythrobacter sp. COR-2]
MTTLLAPSARIAADPAVLGDIAAQDCSLAVWQRPAFADFTPLTTGTPEDLRFTSTPDALSADLARALAGGGFGGGEALHRALIEDAARLARLFCAAMDLASFELRLEVVRTDSCRKFHADYVTARLITTYVGEGTDWLDAGDAARVAAGEEPRRINRLAPFDVGVFKGRLASENPAIHRSPPIAGSPGGVRLLLVLNPVSRRFIDGDDCPLPPPPHLA